jgi:hypothetical protein
MKLHSVDDAFDPPSIDICVYGLYALESVQEDDWGVGSVDKYGSVVDGRSRVKGEKKRKSGPFPS